MASVTAILLVLFAIQAMVFINIIFYMWSGRMLLMLSISRGASMRPNIPKGVTLHIEHYPISINEGEVLIFDKGEGAELTRVGHRAIEVEEDRVLFKGDNNDVDDGWIEKERISGKLFHAFGRVLWLPVSLSAIKETIFGDD